MEETKACAVCGTTTVHYDGACEQCLIRKNHSPVVVVPAEQPTIAKPQERPRRTHYVPVPLLAAMLIAALVIAIGFVHIVHGGGDGCCHVCAKDAWSIGDTFVDLDDYIGKSILQNMDRARVIRAMESCGMLTRDHHR